MNFVKLHDKQNNVIRVNMDNMESYAEITAARYDCSDELIGLTFIVPVGCSKDETCYVVTETPDEIDRLLSELPSLERRL